ncbi:Growth inhibition and differentiation-related 88 [Gossypium arboreum]|uniref:Growth inhibition and differentiation-related 88 n=1 Tax=Gossypium arboreum TaxID=29729 RepID=A0A0B0PTZ8_GOSAR|nr:Growth inhibition and differentiation-related 88 [Gossypium arboreum]
MYNRAKSRRAFVLVLYPDYVPKSIRAGVIFGLGPEEQSCW